MVDKRIVPTKQLQEYVQLLIEQIDREQFEFTRVVGIERGGIPLAETLAAHYGKPMTAIKISYYQGEVKQEAPIVDLHGITFSPDDVVLIVDDLVDTGDTVDTFKRTLDDLCIKYKIAVFFEKPQSIVKPDFCAETTEEWIVFPWEMEETFGTQASV